jgi:hypothetical protein
VTPQIPFSVFGGCNVVLDCELFRLGGGGIPYLFHGAGDVSLDQAAWPGHIRLYAGKGAGHRRPRRQSGLYNGFLAAGLIWALIRDLVHADAGFTFHIKVFFLVCVIIAGVYGGKTVKPKIYKVQAAPAAIALVLVWVAWILH